jgi:hypothetical protein
MGPAGFGVTFGLLLAVVLAYQTGALAGAGWAGGEYANTFVGIAIGAVVVGTVLLAAGRHTVWRPFGIGVLAGGGLGIAFVVVAVVVFWYSFSNFTF